MKICSKGVWDETVPGIVFDENGICNYYYIHQSLEAYFPRGEKGKEKWNTIIQNIKKSNQKYDCIIGVSGGVDSSYLLHLMKVEYGLNPLAVNLDNGWSSDIAVKNIQKITQKLNIDLETFVINYEEIKDLMRAYMLAGLPWIDTPTDMAIKASLYQVANQENIKLIIRGNDFRSEGKQPREWTYSDSKQLKFIHKKFGKIKLKTYPINSFLSIIYYSYFKKIKEIRPFYYLDYEKQKAKQFLIENYDWQDYGGHHHENIFTKFTMAYWLPKKFDIDKRIISLSAQVVSGAITRNQALEALQKPFDTEENMEKLIAYLSKKLDFSTQEFQEIMNAPNQSFTDYPNDYLMIKKLLKIGKPFINLIFKQKPMSFFEMENRNE